MRRAALVLALALALCAPAPLAAEDWLAALDPAEPSGPELALQYPRAELPAVVEAGDELVARLQLPAAIGLPPGVQQAEVLRSFTAELRGDGLPLGTASTHRHRLRVLSVAAQDDSSLLYRVRLRVPAFVAPGTYAFEIGTPFGARAALRAVRVIAGGATVRLARCPPLTAAGRAELGGLPIDVWLCAVHTERLPDVPGSLGLVPAPELHATALRGSIALRVGAALWRFGARAGSATFERELARVAHAEQRMIMDLGSTLPCLSRLPAGADEPFRVERTPRGFTIHSSAARTLGLLIPAAHGVRAQGASLSLFPASDLGLHAARAFFVQSEIRAGETAQLELAPARAPAESSLIASPGRPGQPLRLRVVGAAHEARVAYELGEQSALGGPDLTLSGARPTSEPARALVMSASGGAQLLRAQVLIDARRPPGCSPSPVPRGGGFFGPVLLCSWAGLLKIRRRRGVGNRLRPHVRCELRHGAQYRKSLSPRFGVVCSRRAERLRADHDPQHARGRHARQS